MVLDRPSVYSQYLQYNKRNHNNYYEFTTISQNIDVVLMMLEMSVSDDCKNTTITGVRGGFG